MSIRRTAFLLAALPLCALVRPAAAQQGAPVMVVPRESQHARASQTIGLTDISVDYSRPAVKGRKIWGALVPFDSVWRAGANENTILAVTAPFTVGGVRLPAGRYGVHTIPGATKWTIILSREANNWGSFSYEAGADAARFTVTPQTADHVEWLRYTFEDPADSSVVLTLRWEKLAVAIPMAVSTNQIVMDSLTHQLAGLQQFWPTGWLEAARWAVAHNTGLDQASQWADRALAIAPSFSALRIKAAILERQGNRAAADSLRAQALAIATEPEVNALGYQHLGERRVDEAIALFRQNVRDYPRSWNVYDSLGEALGIKGSRREALAMYQKALDLAPPAQHGRIRSAMAALR
jgi:tetratricopeptide (TPR) repeat protein